MFNFVFTVMMAMQGIGGQSDCASIKDSDRRNYCMAMVTHKSTYCASIKDHDLRHMCYAMTKKGNAQ